MTSSIVSQVADKVLSETLGLKKGETITIETWNNGLQFALEVVRQARRRGAVPILVFEDEKSYLDGVKKMPKDMLGKMGRHEHALISASDAYVFIPGPALGTYYKSLTRQEYADSTRYNSSWYDAAKKSKLRGARLSHGYVGKDLAKLLGKSVREVVGVQLEAALVDLRRITRTAKALESRLKDGKQVVVLSDSGKLEFKLKGESEVEDGLVDGEDLALGQNMTYMPPGYVLKEVAKGSARGGAKVSHSLSKMGVIEDAELGFKKGGLSTWSSKKSGKQVDGLFGGTKPENRRLTYFSIGLNPKMKYGYGQDRFVKGAVCLYGFGFTGVCRGATVTVGGEAVVNRGKISV